MHNATQQLIEQGIEKSALGINDKIPLFELPNAHGQFVAIEDLLTQGPIVLNFYRGGWLP